MATPPKYPPERQPIANSANGLRVAREWLLFFQSLVDQAAAAGSGSVTHTGNLTANELLLGNGVDDIRVLGSFGTAGQILMSNGLGLAPSFQDGSMTNGYWSELTDGDPTEPELIFDSFGDTIDFWVPLP